MKTKEELKLEANRQREVARAKELPTPRRRKALLLRINESAARWKEWFPELVKDEIPF